jgi:hypothetical protein
VCPQQELFGCGKHLGVTVAVDGEQHSGQFIGVAAMQGLDRDCGVVEWPCGRPDGQAVVVQVRRDVENVGSATEPRQQFSSKAAGHGIPLPVQRVGRSGGRNSRILSAHALRERFPGRRRRRGS